MRHYWLSPPGVAVPPRWAEAFPEGRVINVTHLLSHAKASSGLSRMLWLATTDGSWLEQLRRVQSALPAERVVVLSAVPSDKDALRAIAGGARGYAHTHAVPALLHELALVVEHGGYWLGPGPMRTLIEQGTHAMAVPADASTSDANMRRLSAREADVALAVREGHSNKEIARLLGISERTVKAHLGAAFEKLGVRDRLQLVLRLSSPTVARDSSTPLPGWTGPPQGPAAATSPVPPSNRNAPRAGLT